MEGRGEPITILLVDDDEDCRLMIRDAIEEAGVQNNVYEVSSGEEALQDFAKTFEECRWGKA